MFFFFFFPCSFRLQSDIITTGSFSTWFFFFLLISKTSYSSSWLGSCLGTYWCCYKEVNIEIIKKKKMPSLCKMHLEEKTKVLCVIRIQTCHDEMSVYNDGPSIVLFPVPLAPCPQPLLHVPLFISPDLPFSICPLNVPRLFSCLQLNLLTSFPLAINCASLPTHTPVHSCLITSVSI